jgi:DEAD/DEAH box helicase domain-containing protein
LTTAGIQSYSCKEANKVASKLGALIVIKGVLGIEIDPDTIPMEQHDASEPRGRDTIIDASPVRTSGGKIEIEKAP